MHLNFLQWFKKFPQWDTIGWLALIAFGAYWEIMGALYNDRTTFTALVRSTTPIWLRAVVLSVLTWHFCWARANFK